MATKEKDKQLQTNVQQQSNAAPATTATTTTAPAKTQAPTVPTTAAPAATPAPAYNSQYQGQIDDITAQILNRPEFEYNAADDALWNAYVDKYQQGGKLAMKDSMGQTAALTGGYGSSYSQAVGQQTYDAYMTELTDMLPDIEARAWDRYQAEGDELRTQLGILTDAENRDYSRYTYDKEWAWQQTQANRENLTTLISTTGYTPTDEELSAAGMTRGEAEAISKGVIASDPEYAYRMGLIDGEGYKAMTGVYPAGYVPPAAAGGGGGEYYGATKDPDILAQQEYLRGLGYDIAADGIWGPETEKAAKAAQQAEYREQLNNDSRY